MTQQPTQLDQPDPTAEPSATEIATRKALATLELDPRTAELAQMVPGLMQMFAMQQGVDMSGGFPAEDVAEVFQAVTDAWTAATA